MMFVAEHKRCHYNSFCIDMAPDILNDKDLRSVSEGKLGDINRSCGQCKVDISNMV